MIETIQKFLPYVAIVSHVALVLLLISLIFSKSFGREVSMWTGKHALKLGFLTVLGAILGSLFYSNAVGYIPCDLCWWQRIFLYPQIVLFIVALKDKADDLWKYVIPLSSISAVISIYHLYIERGGNSVLPCSAGAACDKLYVLEFGYITIPMMGLTIAIALLTLAWARKTYLSR